MLAHQTTSISDDGVRGERRQTIWVDTFRLGGAARRHDVVRSPNAAFLIGAQICEANGGPICLAGRIDGDAPCRTRNLCGHRITYAFGSMKPRRFGMNYLEVFSVPIDLSSTTCGGQVQSGAQSIGMSSVS